MAAAAFSIRGFAASMRDGQAAEERRPLGIKDLPPIAAPTPRFRWWADELASAVATASAAPSPRRSPGKAKPPKKKRSISDLFAAAPLMTPSDESEQTGVEDDEALYAIVRRAKEEKKRKRRLEGEEEEGAAAAAAAAVASAEGSGLREVEGNSETRKEAPENPNLPDRLDMQSSQKPEASQHLRKEMENISTRRKLGKINKTKKMKKADTPKCVDNNKVDKVGKPQDLENHLPRQSILKYTKLTSVKMVTETHGNSKGKDVIELCRKAVKRVKFSEADDILGSEMQSCEVTKRRSLHKLLADAMASSSSSSSSSMSTEGNKCIPAESSSSHMPKESFTETKEANQNPDHESSSSHMPNEAFTQTKEANQNPDHEDSPEPSNTELSSLNTELSSPLPEPSNTEQCSPLPEPSNTELCSPLPEPSNTELPSHLPEPSDTELPSHLPEPRNTELFDLNEAPYVEQAREENLNSDVQMLDGRDNQRNLSFDSHRLASQLPVSDSESIRNARSAGTLLPGEPVEVSGIDIVVPLLSLRELGETHHDCHNVSVKDTTAMSMSSCALPDHTFQDPLQQHQNGFHTNLNLGGSQLSTGGTFQDSIQQHWNGFHTNLNHGGSQLSTSGKFPTGASRELNVQRDSSPSVGQTLRLMGKDLAVCSSRGETSAETTQKHTGTSTNDYLKTNASLDLPQKGQPFLSLEAQSLPDVTVNTTSTIPGSTYHSSTSQTHLGYRTPHDFGHPIPAANVFSGDRSPYENRFVDFSNSQPNQPFLLGCPPLNHRSAALQQNSLSPWRYYSVLNNRTEPPTAPFWPTSRQHGTPSSAFRGSSPQQHIVHSASSSVRPSSTFSHPARVVHDGSDVMRDAALSSRNLENRMRTAVPGNSNASSSGRYVQKRSGPVKLTPGAKHMLVPSDSTGYGNSVPVYSCVSFGSTSGNAGASQNKGA
ncbi:unnamed protein product [Alopecurus aequalis]